MEGEIEIRLPDSADPKVIDEAMTALRKLGFISHSDLRTSDSIFPKTRKQVMDFIRANEPKLAKDVELVQGEGYMYFTGGIADQFGEQNCHVARVSHLQLNKWLETFRHKCDLTN